MIKLTNEKRIGLSMAVFLAHDDYDYDPRPNSVSATSLLKSTRQTILRKRADASVTEMDIASLMPSTFGNAVHDGIEKAWLNGNYKKAMLKLGFPQKTVDRVRVNPDPKTIKEGDIPVYMEQRAEREVDGIILTGKYDFVGDGELEDHKTTGVYTYMTGSNNEKYRLQGSIYRWLNPDIITSDRMLINFVFTDWSKLRSQIEKDKNYPQSRMMSMPITLMPLDETEKFIRDRINAIKQNLNVGEQSLPLCTPEELWQDPTVYKYYKNPKSKTRATKNFDNFAEAQSRLLQDGSVGEIDVVPGKAKACEYCAGALICSQAKQLSIDGLLDMEL